MARKRKLIVFNRVTADGYFSGSDGSLDFIVPEPEIDKEGVARMATTDTVLFGRRTYEAFASFWPQVFEDPAAATEPHRNARPSPEMRTMAVWLSEATKLVFSRTLKNPTWTNTRVSAEFDPRGIEDMLRQPGKDVIVFGSGSIVSLLTRHGLIDEYRLVVNPILLGSGRPLVSGVPEMKRLELRDAKSYPSGNVMLTYSPAR